MSPSILDPQPPPEDTGLQFLKSLWTVIVVVLGLFVGFIAAFIAALILGWIGIC